MAFTLVLDGEPCTIEIIARRPQLLLRVDGRVYAVAADRLGTAGLDAISIDGSAVPFARGHVGDVQWLRLDGRTVQAKVAVAGRGGAGAGSAAHVIRAPMPGVVIRCHKQPGDAVMRGETVLTIESMKLQMALTSPRDGAIASIAVGEGASFDKDAVLARLVAEGE